MPLIPVFQNESTHITAIWSFANAFRCLGNKPNSCPPSETKPLSVSHITSKWSCWCRHTWTSQPAITSRQWHTDKSQNHRMVAAGRDLCGSSSPTLLLKQGHPEQAVEDLVQTGLEYLQRRRLDNLPGHPVPVLRHPQSEEILPHVQLELPVLHLRHTATYSTQTKIQRWLRQSSMARPECTDSR